MLKKKVSTTNSLLFGNSRFQNNDLYNELYILKNLDTLDVSSVYIQVKYWACYLFGFSKPIKKIMMKQSFVLENQKLFENKNVTQILLVLQKRNNLSFVERLLASTG